MRSLTRKVLMVLAGALACRIALGQDAPARTFVYDVASVKVDNSGSNSRHTSTTYDHFETTNSSLKQMMAIAYGVREDLISGVPEALDSARFDVLAKILDPDEKAWNKMPQEQRRAVLRPLLEGRFSIKLHWETKQLPVYELRMLPGGVKFKATSEENAHAGSSSHICGHDNSMEMKATASSVAELAHQFADDLQRTVIDKTGLTGKYDFTLRWYADNGGDMPADAPPILFTAVQEQLGLKLTSAKGPVAVLVVDHVEMPSAN